MDGILAAIEAAAHSPWLYLALFALVIADAFLVVLPSETAVVALGSLAMSAGAPNLVLVLAVAALGAMVGDNICYLIGCRVGAERFRWMRGPRVQRALSYADSSLQRRPASLILTARYVPFARIAVNLTAGATQFPYRRYLPLTAIAGVSWAIYNCVIGALFGAWLADYPIAAVLLSIVVAVTLGVAVDAVMSRFARRSG